MATFITFSGFPFLDKRSYNSAHCWFFLLMWIHYLGHKN
ncbi:hypothetical protein [uncultured Gammaproteobacteria bacterium]|nr:hypothetical protein [uncultured Gammaproteobacteria bacterium]